MRILWRDRFEVVVAKVALEKLECQTLNDLQATSIRIFAVVARIRRPLRA